MGAATKAAAASAPPSIAFSGAGFLTSYHLGVVDCLRRHGIVGKDDSLARSSSLSASSSSSHPMILSGVSGGALAVTSIVLDIRSDDAMSITMSIAQSARAEGGILDHLHPRFSLVDRVNDAFQKLTVDMDEEEILRRTVGGRIRIGLTDSGYFPNFRGNRRDAYLYVDEFDSLQEILAACILSSYVPGLTGPAPLKRSIETHPAVVQASHHLKQMVARGALKDRKGNRREQLVRPTSELWDGGLVNLFPTINPQSILVTRLRGNSTIRPYRP